MISSIIASVALLSGAALAQVGSAVVVNQCSYSVALSNTPSADNVHSPVDETLAPGGTYSQQWTQLANNNGWSIKLSPTGNDWTSNILQYEYTYLPNDPIWFDLSCVNGNPWDGNWEITATGSCTPRQAAYRFATDDAYGMQSCDASSTITVTLCSGNSGGAAPSSPAQSPSPSSPAWSPSPSPTTATSVPSAASPSPAYTNTWVGAGKNVAGAPGHHDAKKLATTLVTSSVQAWTGAAVTVTNVHYETVTELVTATAAPAKRHVHHPRHPHA